MLGNLVCENISILDKVIASWTDLLYIGCTYRNYNMCSEVYHEDQCSCLLCYSDPNTCVCDLFYINSCRCNAARRKYPLTNYYNTLKN